MPALLNRAFSSALTLSLLLAAALSLQSCSTDPGPETESASLSNVIASPNDKRQYRHVQLSNKLDVLLISDPQADKSAASLDVYVGSYQNPKDREGLAHFLEHMLFLGTEQYPEPGEYQTFIAEHGGNHNAGTGLEHTNYFFDIDAQYLEQALDRFAPFFHSPNFDAKYVDRERNAVESEYRLKIKDDGRRQWDVLQEQVDASHPMSKFTVGNLETLADLKDRPVRAELLELYQQYYSANLMKLVVLGTESLDQLEAMVVPRFSAIANYDTEVEIHGSQLISEKKLPLLIEVEPLKELREISISFQLPKMKPYWRIKPAQYLAALIGHEGQGSLLQLLKDQGWAESLSAGAGLEDRSSSLFSIDIGLTPEGYKQRKQLTRLVFAWIETVRSNGIEAWRYDERASLAAMAFRFQEKQNSMGYVSSLASLMHQYPTADVLRGGYVMESYDQQLIKQVAGRLIPENCFIMLTAPEVTANQVSKRYQVPYKVTAIDAAEVEQWQNPESVAALALSPKNPYIPASLDLLSGSEAESPAPLSNAQGLLSWHMPDSRFGVPKASIVASLGTDKTQTIQGLAMAELYLDIVRDQLNASSYPATEAGLNFALGASAQGLTVNVAGYSDKQPVLLRDVLHALKQPVWNQTRFDQLKQKRLRQLANFQREYPFRQVISGLYSMLTGRWTPLQKAPVVEAVTMEQVKKFASSLLTSMELKLLISGNHNQQVAEDIQRQFIQSFTLMQIDNPSHIAKLTAGSVQGQVPVDHEDAVSVLYFQATDDSLQQRAATSLVAEMLSAPFYNSLRTEKQLGYVVSAFASHQGPVPGLAMLVQSPVADEQQLRAEFEGFINDYGETVAGLSADDLSRYQDSLLSSLEEKPKNLAEMNGRFMESLALGYRDFDFRAQLAAAIRQVDIATLQQAFQQLLVEQRRAVWVTTAKAGQVNSAVDLRENSETYSYDF